jgi:hypothetical protein
MTLDGIGTLERKTAEMWLPHEALDVADISKLE